MKSNQSKNYEEWLEKAHEDELTARKLLKTSRLYAPICFHFQQMAEKYLKSLLVCLNKPFLKVHDLISLENILIKKFPEIHKMHSNLKLLNRFYIETRYPGSDIDFNLHDAQKADFAATKIKSFVLKIIKSN